MEFLPLSAASLPNPPHFDAATFEHRNTPPDRFSLETGQWTDDTSMSMCLADGLIENEGAYVGSLIRTKYWLWWNVGLNNSFRKSAGRPRHSVGLGGNIKQSLDSIAPLSPPTNDYKPPGRSQDAGNGSLMRLAPISICFHRSQWSAMAMAKQSSSATHPGPMAADACAFLSFVLVKAIDGRGAETVKCFLDDCRAEFLDCHAVTVCDEVRRLVRAEEPGGGTESVWNWREEKLPIEEVR